MNKKAIFMPTLAIATLFLLIYAFYVFIVKDPTTEYYGLVGSNQIAITNAYKDAENDLFYAEQAVKYSIDKTSEEFSNNGGVNQECNSQWVFDDQKCNPDLENNFNAILKKNLINYGLDLEQSKIENNIIQVKLKDKIYSNNLTNLEFKYKVKQEFKEEIALDFSNLLNIKNNLYSCTIKNKPDTCLNNFITKGSIIYFTIENHKNIFTLSQNPGFKKLEFKFNIDNENPRKRSF